MHKVTSGSAVLLVSFVCPRAIKKSRRTRWDQNRLLVSARNKVCVKIVADRGLSEFVRVAHGKNQWKKTLIFLIFIARKKCERNERQDSLAVRVRFQWLDFNSTFTIVKRIHVKSGLHEYSHKMHQSVMSFWFVRLLVYLKYKNANISASHEKRNK